MADAIEQYLFLKFKNAVDAKDNRGNPVISSHGDFEQLKRELENAIATPSSHVDSTAQGPSSIRHILYSLNNMVIDYQPTSKKRLSNKFSFGNKFSNIKRDIRDINSKKPSIPEASQLHPVQKGSTNHTGQSSGPSSGNSLFFGWCAPDIDDKKTYGIEEERVKNLMKSLIPKVPFKAIAIVGISGIGKTTMCQLFFKKAKDDFVPRIWVPISIIRVSVSGQDDEEARFKKAIIRGMLMQIGAEEDVVDNEFSQHGLGGLVSLLHQHLWGKRYLIVLDGVQYNDVVKNEGWYEDLVACLPRGDDWEKKLAYGLPKGHGGTVIVTSRSEDAAKKMVGQKNIHKHMPLEEAKHYSKIFKDAAGTEDVKIGSTEIKEKFKGVPLAAKVMGQLVKNDRGANAELKHE